MTHPQLEDLKAAVRRAGFEQTLVYVPPLRLGLGFVTIPNHTDDGYGKVTYFEETLLPLPACCGLTNGDIARWLKARNLKALDRSAEFLERQKWATPLENPDSACELLLTVLTELYRVPPTQGLFITSVPDTDDWPDPIPAPGVWPPL